MNRRIILLINLVSLICLLISPAAMSEMDYSTVYESAVRLAGNDLTNLDNLQDALVMLDQIGAYSFTKSYVMYFQALLEIQDKEDYDTATLRLGNCSRKEGFVADLQEQNLPSCDELLKYIDARRLESGGNIAEAYSAFVGLAVLDSPERAFNLSLLMKTLPTETKVVTYTPASTPAPTPTPTPKRTAKPKASIPAFSETYPGTSAKLRSAGDDGYRVYSFAGPGKVYVPTGGYKPAKQRKVTVFFEEDGYVFADVAYQTVEERYIYLPRSGFGSLGDIPSVSKMKTYTGTATDSITPVWGPDDNFKSTGDYVCKKGTKVEIFFKENGYLYAEYTCDKGLVRMWLPEKNIKIKK